MKAITRLACALGVAVLSVAASSEEIRGKVISITDGDTLTVLDDKEKFKIRLEGIDAPEIKQPIGTQARKALSELGWFKQFRSRPER